MVEIKEVLRLWRAGTKKKQIATQLTLDVKTVRRYIAAAESCGGKATGTVKFFNVMGRNVLRNFGGNNDFLYAVGVSPDGALVATGGQESVVRVYNGTNAQLLRTLQPPNAGAKP